MKEVNQNLTASQEIELERAKGLAKWFSVDVTIKIFGVVIFQYHFPPKN